MKTFDINRIICVVIASFSVLFTLMLINPNIAYSASMVYVSMGIKGSSQEALHLNWIEASSFSMGVSDNYSGSSGTLNKPTFQPVTITKQYDMASPTIAYNCATAKSIKQVVIEIDQFNVGKLYTPIHIELDNALISSVNSTLTEGASPSLMEVVSLTYSKICWMYTPLKQDGTTDTPVTSCFDLTAAK